MAQPGQEVNGSTDHPYIDRGCIDPIPWRWSHFEQWKGPAGIQTDRGIIQVVKVVGPIQQDGYHRDDK